jgi:FkbM family methyltransferase
METREIKLVDNTTHIIKLETPEAVQHFNSWNNYTDAILEHFNSKNYYQDFISESDKVILDLGANVGLFALYVSPIADKVVCVEPTPSHFNILKQLTKEFKQIEHIQAAISNVTETIKFFTSVSNTTMNSLIPRDGSWFETEGYSLEDLIKKLNIDKVDFVKMDIEGSEYTVLDAKTIDYIGENIPKILIEFHGDSSKYGDIYAHIRESIPDYIKIFENKGYKVNHFNWDSIFCQK